MANTNTVASVNGSSSGGALQKTAKTLALGTSTTETAFSFNTNPINSSFGGGVAFVSIPASALPPAGRFRVRFTGSVTTFNNDTLTLKIYTGALAAPNAVSATLGSDNAVYAPTGVATGAAGSFDWFINVDCMYEPVSGKLIGSGYQLINGTASGPTAITPLAFTPVPAAGFPSTVTLSFLLSAKFTTGFAGNLVSIDQATLDFGE